MISSLLVEIESFKSFLKSGNIGYPGMVMSNILPKPFGNLFSIVSNIKEWICAVINCLLSSMNLGGVILPDIIFSGKR